MAQKQRILVVDDQKAIADTFAVTLAARGFDVCVAYGGIAAADLGQAIHPDDLLAKIRGAAT